MAKSTVSTDAVSVDSKHYKVEDENERVRVLRARYGPGEKSEMHSHPDLVALFVTDGDIRFTYPDGSTEDAHVTSGQSMIMAGMMHLPENLSDQPFEVVLVELKK
jgi:quercetin dioxygenase-like cupin family protein